MAALQIVTATRVFQNSRILQQGRTCSLYKLPWVVWQSYRKCSGYGLKGDTVRIGCASGFWGDTAVAAPQLIHHGKLDYLVLDYLSEITMSLLTAAKTKNPSFGYAPDFVQVVVAPYMKDIKKKGLRVISNAGGVNPHGCAAAIQEVAKKEGLDVKVAVITGDDLMPKKDELLKSGILEMDSKMTLPQSVQSMTAYLGAGAISQALDLGADIVVTGRCTDSALVLAPLLHRFRWSHENYDLLAAGSLAGHLIECGAQVTGGVFTDWHKVPDWHNIGFPIVECSGDGDFVVTKPPKTGGLVSQATVSEQLVYEIGDPANYILPDVICDFSHVSLLDIPGQEGTAVKVSGARGKPPSTSYKVSATYLDGYRATAVCNVGGPRAKEKGQRTAEAILKRTRGIFKALGLEDFTKTHVQLVGSEQTYGPHANPHLAPRETIVWMAVQHQQKKALEIFAREIAPAGTGMAPGLTGIVGGRPKPSPVLKLFSFLYPKTDIKVNIEVDGQKVEYQPIIAHSSPTAASGTSEISSEKSSLQSGDHSYHLEELAYTRSGDKGNHVNIGVVARNPAFVPYLRHALTEEHVAAYFAHLFENNNGPLSDRITRYELPGIHGFNFLLRNALGGGGVASLRTDPQGKAIGQMLLDFKIENVPDLVQMAQSR